MATSLISALRRRANGARGPRKGGRSPYLKDKSVTVPVAAGPMQYVETEFRDYVVNKFLDKCAASRINVFCKELRFDAIPAVAAVVHTILTELGYDHTVLATSSHVSKFIGDTGIVSTSTTSNSTRIEIIGSQQLIDEVSTRLLVVYDEILTTVEWVTGTDGSSVTIPLSAPQGITDSAYPFIEEGIEQFVDEFLKSTETVLLLTGEPGTGKSTLIKYIIARSQRNAMITYDPEIMKRDAIFAQFLEYDCQTLILEDADAFLAARTEGNLYMSRFLNLSSGIVSMPKKKLIFSTNLENLDDVDAALLRPGRCHAVINFRKLDFTESVKFCEDHHITEWSPTPGEAYSLAELYNYTKRIRQVRSTKNKVGFY